VGEVEQGKQDCEAVIKKMEVIVHNKMKKEQKMNQEEMIMTRKYEEQRIR
jgi:hypothetical protein